MLLPTEITTWTESQAFWWHVLLPSHLTGFSSTAYCLPLLSRSHFTYKLHIFISMLLFLFRYRSQGLAHTLLLYISGRYPLSINYWRGLMLTPLSGRPNESSFKPQISIFSRSVKLKYNLILSICLLHVSPCRISPLNTFYVVTNYNS